MGSTRVSAALCIVLLVAGIGTLPVAVSAQEDRVTITATIVDQNGRSVGDGVDVTASWDSGSTNETTKSNGQVLLDVSPGANVSVQIDDDRYVRNDPYPITDASAESIEVPVTESGTATVTVRDAANETVEDAKVRLRRGGSDVTDQRTGADGTVTTPPIERGSYSVVVEKAGFYNNRSRIDVDGKTNVTQTIEQGEVLLTIAVEDDYFDPPEAIAATVEIPGIATLQTGSDGDASTTVPVNTRHDITVTAEGYDQTQRTVRVGEEDMTATVSLNRADRLDIDARERVLLGNPITIDVTDEYNDSVENATVTRNGEQVGMTDGDGEFEYPTEEAGVVTLTVDDGDIEATVSVDVVSDSDDLEPTTSPTSPTSPTATETAMSSGSGPGFTPVTVVAALALLSLVAFRRR